MSLTIDSNILLSLLIDDKLAENALSLLSENRNHDYLINEIIYLELLSFFENDTLLNKKLSHLEIEIADRGVKNSLLLIKAWKKYLKQKTFHCPSCGSLQKITCSKCGSIIKTRQKILPDFLIGEFALSNTDGIITFDSSFYKNYFKDLVVIES